MMGVLMALGWLLLTLLKIAGVLLLILLVLLALVLLCPLCADVCWEGGVLTVRAGALGLTLPVFSGLRRKTRRIRRTERLLGEAESEAPRPPRSANGRKPPQKSEETEKKQLRAEAKLTLNILVTILRGAGRLTKAVFGSLRVTRSGLPRRPGRRPRRSRPRLRQAERMALPVPRRHRPLRLPRFRRAAHPAGLRQCRADGGRPGVVPPQRKAAFHRCSRCARFV